MKRKWSVKLQTKLQISLLASAIALFNTDLLISIKPASAQSVCPSIGHAPICNTLFTLNNDVSITTQLQAPIPYDGNDDNLVGVYNNSTNLSLDSIIVTGTGIANFDGDGISTFNAGTYGPTGYEGPNTKFLLQSIDNNSVIVGFTNPLGPGQSAFFSLEEAPDSATNAAANRVSKKDLHNHKKDAAAQLSNSLNLGGGAVGIGGGIACAVSGGLLCPVVFGAATGALLYEAYGYGKIPVDPSDPNFTQIAQPITPTLLSQPFTKTDLGTQQLADSFNALLTNQEESIGLENALTIAINRASGAFDVRNTYWENQQIQSAQSYVLQLAALAQAAPSLYANFANDYKAAGLPNPKISVNDVLAFQNTLKTNGLPSTISQTLSQLGADSATQNSILQSLLSLNPSDVVALGDGIFPDSLIDPSFTSSLNQTGQVLSQGILGANGSTSVPEPSENLGFFALDFVGLFLILKRKQKFI